LKFKNIIAPCFYALVVGLALAAPTEAAAQTAPNTTDTSSNGSSTGVGNAGSFGIGSGTANGNATATATSNGVSDSNNITSVRSDLHTDTTDITAGTVAVSNSSLSQTVSGIPASAGYNVPNTWSTGNIAPASISNSNGIVTNGANTGVSSNVGVVISVTPGAVQASITH
jgi:hypothetical protein